MSIDSVSLQNNSSTNVQQTMANPAPDIDGLWQSRMVQNACCGLTKTEVTCLSLRLFGFAAGSSGIAAVAVATLGVVAWPIGLLAIPAALVTTGAIWYSFQFNDYENPEELAKFREDASRMSLQQVMQTHGWSHVLRWGILTSEQFTDKFRQQMRGKNLIEIIDSYENGVRHLSQCPSQRFDYQVPVPSAWRGQWRTETSTKTFENIISTYPLDKLERYHLLEPGEMNRIKDIKRDYDVIKGQYDTQKNQIERDFQSHTEIHQRTYQSDCARADQLYNDNWAVRRLKVFEFDYIRERQVVHETANRHKTEARDRFDRSVSTVTNHGQIPYDRLLPRDKILYDQQNQELQISVMQADNDARLQITHIDSRCIGERSRLNAEEVRVKDDRVRMINQAKGHYDIAVASPRQHKEQRMVPIEAAFRSTVDNLNGRYLAYLRTVGAIR
jgi:hypothetical protein